MALSGCQAVAVSCEMKNQDTGSAEAGHAPIELYHKTQFWKKLEVGVVAPADAKTVLAATKDLCRHFIFQENRPLFMQKTAKLAAQLFKNNLRKTTKKLRFFSEFRRFSGNLEKCVENTEKI
ncbi:hypothetical protein V9T40_001750 [Parthenolecanium corni]|uniref:Uncharacterized protein n=1 Tax=Parthenolecanium corni TaxID=536013 RepID=A0AAN9TF26_9HEMI